jgi:hypothetical protein
VSTKNLYHSELVQRGPVSLTIKSYATPSQYADKPDWILVFDHEEGMERRYSVENQNCAELGNWKGRRVIATAAGSRSSAYFEDIQEDASGEDESAPRRPAAPPARRPGPPARPMPQRPTQQPPARRQAPQRTEAPAARRLTKEEREAAELKAYRGASKYAAQVAVVLELSGLYVTSMLERLKEEKGVEFSSESVEKLIVTHFIETKGRVDIASLPVKMPTPPAEKPRGETYVEPEPEPEPQREEETEIEEDDLTY